MCPELSTGAEIRRPHLTFVNHYHMIEVFLTESLFLMVTCVTYWVFVYWFMACWFACVGSTAVPGPAMTCMHG